jgi:hypothetical protein
VGSLLLFIKKVVNIIQSLVNSRIVSRTTISLFSRYWLVFVLGFLSAQRFLLSDMYAYFVVIPLVCMCIAKFRKRISRNNYWALIALLMLIDNGGFVYTETPSWLRYVTWILCLGELLASHNFRLNRLIFLLMFLTIPAALAGFNYDMVHFGSLIRDLYVCGVLVLCIGMEPKSSYDNDFSNVMNALVLFGLGVLLAEFFNSSSIPIGEYANYTSIKAIVILPSLYAIASKRYFIAAVLMPLTVYVLFLYVTRMIFIAYLMGLTVLLINYFFNNTFLKSTRNIIFSSLIVIFCLWAFFTPVALDSNKFLSIFYVIFEQDYQSITELMILIDPTRFYEFKMIFDSSLFNIIFGHGLGMSYADINGYFSFLGSFAPDAFSEEETRSGIFYNFHEIWVDVGYRFGLLAVVLCVLWVLPRLKSKDSDIFVLRIFMITILLCSFWSTSGALFMCFLVRHLKTRMKKYSVPRVSNNGQEYNGINV